MSEKKPKREETKISTWLKSDGKTEIKLNAEPATLAHAKKMGWKRK